MKSSTEPKYIYMKKFFIATIAACVLLSSCADNYKYTDNNGENRTAEPYGWADYKKCHADSIEYELCVPNIIVSAIFVETVIVPVWLTGWQMFEPVGIEGEPKNTKTFLPN